jgi:arabinose-5-phosphate isomerase
VDILQAGIKTLEIEIDALNRVKKALGADFISAVETIYNCKGRVVVTGMGKSGHIGKKIAATFASTGTPSLFLHPAEGVHGDLGMLVRGDVVIALSNSGETREILDILPVIKRFDIPLICIVGKTVSTLAKKSDHVLDASVDREACPLNLAPTASTTAALAMGDCLAVALLEKRGFKKEDFAVFHPSGSLGKQLLLKVSDIFTTGANMPKVSEGMLVSDALFVITSKGFGCTTVTDKDGKLIGILTDGDLRRGMAKFHDFIFSMNVEDVCTKSPKTISDDALAAKALSIMETHSITVLITVDAENKPTGILHMHDLLKAGLA